MAVDEMFHAIKFTTEKINTRTSEHIKKKKNDIMMFCYRNLSPHTNCGKKEKKILYLTFYK